MEKDVTERMVYRMFFLGRNFVSSLIVMNSASLNLGIETYKCKPLYSIVSGPRVILCRDWLRYVT